MTSVESKIENYERKIVQHEAEIEMIKNGEGIYSDLVDNASKRNAIKSVKDAIHDCEARILQLGQQQGKILFLYSSVFF